jgi:predicted nicotinamide N-methyase
MRISIDVYVEDVNIVKFKDFSFQVRFPSHLTPKICLIKKVPMHALRGAIYSGNYEHPKIRLHPIDKTPHHDFVTKESKRYLEYLHRFREKVGWGIEHSPKAYRLLLDQLKNREYLSIPYNKDYIICKEVKSSFRTRYQILDGLHRAAYYASVGVDSIPIAVYNVNLDGDRQLIQFVKDFRDDFLEWYAPVKVTDKYTIQERTYPDFHHRKHFLWNRERGLSKWNYIIRKNLPDVEGLVIYDIGAGCGLFSLELARMGAKRVIGIDRDEYIIQPSNPRLPAQDVVNQAYFVRKIFELKDGCNYSNVEFIPRDIGSLDFREIDADMIFSCCVLYHFFEKMKLFINQIAEKQIQIVFLQTNLGHKGELAKWASLKTHKSILEGAGYKVRIDAPQGYSYPIIVGYKQ